MPLPGFYTELPDSFSLHLVSNERDLGQLWSGTFLERWMSLSRKALLDQSLSEERQKAQEEHHVGMAMVFFVFVREMKLL